MAGMTINKRINVTLNENEYEFLNWLAKRDSVTVPEEMRLLFNLQLSEEMDLYENEYKGGRYGNRSTETRTEEV